MVGGSVRREFLAVAGVVAALAVACGDGDTADPEVLARGERLYAASCIQCHGGPTGGHISDIPPPHNAEGHTWHHADCDLVDIVLDGLPPRAGASGGDIMPAFRGRLSEDDVEAILAYIKTWWTDEQRRSQAEVTAAVCDAG